MVHELRDYTKAIDFLRTNALANHHLLLSLEAGIPGVPHEVYVDNPEEIKSVMIVEHFGQRENWVSLESSQEESVLSLLQVLPSDKEYGFILHRNWMRPLVQKLFGVEFTGKRFDYTVDGKKFCPYTLHKARQLTLDVDEEPASKYPRAYGPHGPSLLDLLRKQETGQGLMVFGIIEKDEIVSHATLEADLFDIWSTHPFTREQYRGKGYGKAVMSQATQVGLSMDKLLYYDAGPNNPPAMKIAKALGYFAYQEVVWGKGRRVKG